MNRLSMSLIRIAREPSAIVTGFPPGVTIGAFALVTPARAASMSRTTSTSAALPGSWMRSGTVWCGTFCTSMISTLSLVPGTRADWWRSCASGMSNIAKSWGLARL